jgi:hypothetical protein
MVNEIQNSGSSGLSVNVQNNGFGGALDIERQTLGYKWEDPLIKFQGIRSTELKTPLNIDLSSYEKNEPDRRIYRGEKGKVDLEIKDEKGLWRDVIEFTLDDSGAITGAKTGYNNAYVAYFLETGLDTKTFSTLKSALSSTGINLDITPPQREQIKEAYQEKLNYGKSVKENIAFANSKGKNYQPLALSPNTTRGVLQHEYAIVNSTDVQNKLATYGAGPCLILAIYNPTTKTAGLAHIDALTTPASVGGFIYQLKNNLGPGAQLQVHLAGGDRSSEEMVSSVIDMIKQDKDLKLVSSDVIGSGYLGEAKQLAIDAATGVVSNSVVPSQIDSGPNVDIRLQTLGFQFTPSGLKVSPKSNNK